MYGKSWSAFNSIMLAMSNHPALKTFISVHGSDDLYHDDIHFIDGVLHLDEYIVSVDHENALPQSIPSYPIDESYFRDRFHATPLHMTYLKEQIDGPFWRKNSLKYNLSSISIPAYFIGGLYDGYRYFHYQLEIEDDIFCRDTPVRVCQALHESKVPCKVISFYSFIFCKRSLLVLGIMLFQMKEDLDQLMNGNMKQYVGLITGY
jgi:predicted acyl esterase